jgi:hypothetical protein
MDREEEESSCEREGGKGKRGRKRISPDERRRGEQVCT